MEIYLSDKVAVILHAGAYKPVIKDYSYMPDPPLPTAVALGNGTPTVLAAGKTYKLCCNGTLAFHHKIPPATDITGALVLQIIRPDVIGFIVDPNPSVWTVISCSSFANGRRT